MIGRTLKSVVGRLVVVACLAIVLIAGTVAVHQPSHADAKGTDCLTAVPQAQLWTNYANLMMANGRPLEAAMGLARAEDFWSGCDNWA
jgi:hypothetical protein